MGGFVVWIGGGVSFTLAGEGIRVSSNGESVCGRGDLIKVFVEDVTPGAFTVGERVHVAYLKNSIPFGGMSDDTGHFRNGTTVCWGVDANNYFIRVQGKFLSEKEGREREMSVRFSGKLMTSTTI